MDPQVRLAISDYLLAGASLFDLWNQNLQDTHVNLASLYKIQRTQAMERVFLACDGSLEKVKELIDAI